MNLRGWIVGAAASLTCGLGGYALGVHHEASREAAAPSPPPPEAPRPVPVPPPAVVAVVDAGGLPGLPTKVSLTEPKLDDGVLDPHRPPPAHDGGGRSGRLAAAVETTRPTSPEAPPAPAAPSPTETEQQLEAMSTQLKELQAQLAEAQQQVQEREQAAEQRAANQHAAMVAIQRADSSLAQGGTDIQADLDQAEASLEGQAAGEIQSVRQAVQNGDLFTARQHLQRALLMGAQGNPNSVPAPSPGP